jgi:hypothetical protein
MFTMPSAASLLRRRQLRVRGGNRALLRRAFAGCLAAAVLAATLGAGRAYLWCSMMQQRVDTCCCEPERHAAEERSETRQELRNGCCESQQGATLAAGIATCRVLDVPAAFPAADLPRTELASVVASWPPLRARAARGGSSRERPIRAGPRGASEVCIRLQVFRCGALRRARRRLRARPERRPAQRRGACAVRHWPMNLEDF